MLGWKITFIYFKRQWHIETRWGSQTVQMSNSELAGRGYRLEFSKQLFSSKYSKYTYFRIRSGINYTTQIIKQIYCKKHFEHRDPGPSISVQSIHIR